MCVTVYVTVLLRPWHKYPCVCRDVVHVRATVISGEPNQGMTAADSDQLTSVILGLLRQNSFTFLEVLDAASITAVKHVIRDVGLEVLVRDDGAAGETGGDQVRQ